jgi:hypothetical protein
LYCNGLEPACCNSWTSSLTPTSLVGRLEPPQFAALTNEQGRKMKRLQSEAPRMSSAHPRTESLSGAVVRDRPRTEVPSLLPLLSCKLCSPCRLQPAAVPPLPPMPTTAVCCSCCCRPLLHGVGTKRIPKRPFSERDLLPRGGEIAAAPAPREEHILLSERSKTNPQQH